MGHGINPSLATNWAISHSSQCYMTSATSLSTMKDRSDDPSHHERMLLPLKLHPVSGVWERMSWSNSWILQAHPGKRNSSMGPSWRIDPTTPSHYEWTLLPWSYISLHREGSIWRPIAPGASALTTALHPVSGVWERVSWCSSWILQALPGLPDSETVYILKQAESWIFSQDWLVFCQNTERSSQTQEVKMNTRCQGRVRWRINRLEKIY